MAIRRIAACAPEFWKTHAAFASASRLAERYPKASGGLTLPGWGNAMKRARIANPEFDWLYVPNGSRPPQWADDEWPPPVYEDELPTTGRYKPGPTAALDAPNVDPADTYRESTEILADGSHKSDKLLRMSENDSKDPRYLLQAHGFDSAEWELVSAKNNIWNVFSKKTLTVYSCKKCNKQVDGPTCPDCNEEAHKDVVDDGHDISTLYASKITARPLVDKLDVAAIVEAVCEIRPIRLQRPTIGACMLEIGNTDMHFGNSTLDWYIDSLDRTVAIINAKRWEHVLIPIGSDLFHCDNFKNTTSNGTPQSSVAWPEAWADALSFYATVIEAALKRSKEVWAYYIIGNHDESMSWAFCQMLAARYPQVKFDLRIEERKVHTFGETAVGMTHGDARTNKDVDRVFLAEFPEFANAAVKEVHSGHVHHEVTVDEYGVVVRRLPTAARTDKWHREEGFVGARKRFQLFEWSRLDLEHIHYV